MIRQDLQSVTKKGRQKLFSTIPKSVDEAYTTILNKSTDKNQARRLLQIVCVATRPLSVKEMSIAISIQPNDKAYEDLEILPEEYCKKFIRNLCGLFVSVIDGRVFLLHQTAKEFLIAQEDHNQTASSLASDEIWKNSLSTQDSSFLLASICLWFLRLEEFHSSSVEGEEIDHFVSRYEFLQYSAMNWAVYFRAARIPEGHPLIELALELCNVQANQSITCQIVFWKRWYKNSPTGLNNLHLASLLGLGRVVGQLLAAPNIDINAADSDGQTPLWWAAREGYKTVVGQLLATSGIDVNAADNNGPTPLWQAAYKGHETVVGQLLATPAINANVADKRGHTPLLVAQHSGYKGITKALENRLI